MFMTCFTPRFAEGHPLRRDLELAIYVLPRGKMGLGCLGRRDAWDPLPKMHKNARILIVSATEEGYTPYKIAEISQKLVLFLGLF